MTESERTEVEEAARSTGVETDHRLSAETPCGMHAAYLVFYHTARKSDWSMRFCFFVLSVAGCGEIYCSDECRDKAWSEYHALLCVGARPEAKEAIEEFNDHSDGTQF